MVVLLMWYQIPVTVHFSAAPIEEGESGLCKNLINQNMPDWDWYTVFLPAWFFFGFYRSNLVNEYKEKAVSAAFHNINDKKLSFCRESAHLPSLYCTVQKAFPYV